MLNATKYLGNFNIIVICVLKNLPEKLFEFRRKLTEIMKSFIPAEDRLQIFKFHVVAYEHFLLTLQTLKLNLL